MKGYKDSVRAVAKADLKADMFDRSIILAFVFEKDNTKVMDDLVAVRRGR